MLAIADSFPSKKDSRFFEAKEFTITKHISSKDVGTTYLSN
jgi:hypothetical protein